VASAQVGLEDFKRLSAAPRTAAQQAWEQSLTMLDQIIQRKQLPQDSLVVLLKQQKIIERAEREVRVLPLPPEIQPLQQKHVAGYQAQEQALDLLFQLLVTGNLEPQAQTQLTEAIKDSITKIREVNQTLNHEIPSPIAPP